MDDNFTPSVTGSSYVLPYTNVMTGKSKQAAKYVLLELFVRVATLPYYRLYHFNTAQPLEKIAKIASESPFDSSRLLGAMAFWRARKLAELQFISIAVRTTHRCLSPSSFCFQTVYCTRRCSHRRLLMDHDRRCSLAHARVLAQQPHILSFGHSAFGL
jgi:hypothetical protein